MKLPVRKLPEAIAVRFYADFDVQIQPKEISQLKRRQRGLLQAIAASPATLRRIARMSLETDLAGITGRHLSGLFDGPDNEEILQCVLPCLSDVERVYWQGLRDAPGDTLHDAITPVFLAFDARLRVAGIEERSTDVEPCKKTVGPILDAHDLGQ